MKKVPIDSLPRILRSAGAVLRSACAGAALLAASSMYAGSFSTDFNSGLPAGTTVYGVATNDVAGGYTNSGCLKLTTTQDSVGGSFIITNDLDAGTQVVGFLARFKAYVGGGTGADGFSISFAPDLPEGVFAFGEEGAGTGFSVGFDTYSNANDTVGIKLKAYGNAYGNNSSVNLRANTFVDVVVHLKPNGYLDVLYDGTYAFTNWYIGYTAPLGSKFGFGARTGGLNDNHWIDDLSITTYTNGQTVVDFYTPIGRNVPADANIGVTLIDVGLGVDASKLALTLDGATVVPTVSQVGMYTTVNYVPPALFASGSSHVVSLTYADNATPVPNTNIWTYGFKVATYSILDTNLIAPPSLVSANRGFAIRVSQIEANRGPTIQRAENQLAGLLLDPNTGLPYVNRATMSATNEPCVINYSTAGYQGSFPTELPNTIPGLPGVMPDSTTADTNAALDAVTYLYLTPGLYRLGVNSSDGFRLTAASTPDLYAKELAIYDTVRAAADSLYTFGVLQAGYYPFRICYFIGGSEIVYPTADVPSLEFFSEIAGTKALVNDTNTAGSIAAYLPAQTLPYVRSVSPISGSTGVPKNTALDVTLVDGTITVAPATASIQMFLNGVAVSPTVTYGVNNGGVTLIHYQPPSPLPLNTSNFVQFAFTDSAANRRTNSFSFITENVLTQLFAIPPASTANPTWAKWVTSGGTERGIAYNPKTGHVLVVSRNTATGADGPNGCGIAILDGNDGHYIGQLNMTLGDGTTIKDNGIGLFKVNMVDIADDGVIYVCPLQTSWNTGTFNIYRWANESAVPTICVASPQLGVIARVGDDFCVRGSGAGTQIIASGNSAVTNVAMFTTADGTNFTGTSLNVRGLPTASVRLGLAFGCGNNVYGETTGNFLRYFNFTGPSSTAASLVNSYLILDAAGKTNIGPIGIDIRNQRIIAASTAGSGGAAHSMNLFDLDALVAWTTPYTNRPIDSKPFPVNVGTFGTGSVDFTPEGTRVYTLDSGSGVIAFSLAPKLGLPNICAQPQQFIIQPTNTIGFMDVMAIGSPQAFYWRLHATNILAGATNRTLDIYNVKQSDLGWYSVVITNPLGSVTSAPALLDIQMVITNWPATLVATQGLPTTFTVGVAGGAYPLSYQWRFYGSNIAGANASTYTIPNADFTNAGFLAYSVVVTDCYTQTVASASATLNVLPAVDATPGTGTGLLGAYYTNADYGTATTPPMPFTSVPALVRVDPTVDFDWLLGSFDDATLPTATDFFQVRWAGQVQPLYTQPYTFYTTSDDGARLWVNSTKLVDDWTLHPPTEHASPSINLVANQKYDIVYEFFEKGGGAVAKLWWWSPSQVKTNVPMLQLYPAAGPWTPVFTSGLSNGTNLVLNWVGTCVLQSAPAITGPWTSIATNSGPYTVNVTGAPEAYFRLLSQQF